MILLIIFLITFSGYLCKCYIYLANMFQQNHYDYHKYFQTLNSYYLKKKYQYFYYWGLLFCLLSFVSQYFLYLTNLFLIVATCYKNHYIIKLKWTKRIIRHFITSLFLCVIYILCFYKITILIYLLGILLPLIIVLASLINAPIEALIKKHYQKQAKTKLDKAENLVKIAITGSFGKTSTKNIINEILMNKYLTLKTPKSYNTLMGLTLTINQSLNNETEIFISEMGAFFPGEIQEMATFIKPDIAIITEIGMQHLSTFKSLDNITKAKFEIAKGLTSSGCLILNYDNQAIREYDIKQLPTNKIYTYGIENGKYHVKNLNFSENITSFSIYDGDQYLIDIKTKLLGRHNVLNILAAYVCLKALETYQIYIKDTDLVKIIANMSPTLHRLSYQEQPPFHIYDDSYSSNIVGFKYATEVLTRQKGKKIIITPGIVDGGAFDEKLNIEIASIINDSFDEIYLIENKSSKIIESHLTNPQTYCFSTFKKAYLTILTKYNDSDEIINILIENDLPDSFLER